MKNNKAIRHIISVPFMWLPLLPALLIHLVMAFCQQVTFRLFGIERVKLSSYVVMDRDKLPYLSLVEKVNCMYCSYMNGLFIYLSEIAHRLEYYWCGIKHRNQPDNPAFGYQSKFAAYGSEDEFDDVMIKSGHDEQQQ